MARPVDTLALRAARGARSAATSMASLFYLVPAVTSLMAYAMFGERLDALSIAGMVVCAVAVLLVNWRRAG
jgi:drug/metabolite transporter (DMT)-like permease